MSEYNNDPKNSRQDFLNVYEDKIQEVVNQDSVRAETVEREIANGTSTILVKNTVLIGSDTYTQALNSGFSDEQAFTIAMRYMFGE